MAYINLYAVLGTLENLCEIVPEASAMLTNTKPISIGFEVKDGPSATITFKNGRCRMEQGVNKCDVKLPFSSCEKFNGLIDGTVTPIPSKGFQHIKFLLKTFTPLTDLLAKYMRPSPEDLQDRTFFEQSTTLMLYTIAVAISQIANNDKIGQFSASHIVDGEIGFGIKDGPAVTIRAKNGRLVTIKKRCENPRAEMEFASMDLARDLFDGKIFERAEKVIPSGVYGHLGPAEGCFIPVSAFPLFGDRAQGSYFWDVDGNKFIDYMCAYGPNVLGYNDPDVDAAALEQAKKCNCTTSPSYKAVEFAELLVDTVNCADWAFFAKNGNDVTTAAIMTARAHTHRKKIIFINGFYHGISPWTQKVDYPGVLEEDVANNIYIDWNDIPALERAIAENEGEIAAFISTPYLHGNFFDNQLPADGYWQKVRELCTKNGIVLIVDDVRAGFRLDIAGSDHFYGFEADLICFCKALANGWNVSALCGKDFLKSSISSLSYTGSYWLSAIPFAAGIACINKMKKLNTPALFREKGLKVGEGLKAAAANNGFHLVVSGEPSLFYLRLADDDSLMLHQEWVAEMVKRGIFITSHHNHFLNASLTDEDIAHTVDVAEDAFNTLRKNHPELA